MKWTFENFEPELKNLNPKVKEKALEIAKNLMENDDYSKEEAIKEAVKQAEEWFLNSQG